MKLLFIYGPPAVGKLTVANEIAKGTGFKVFHNHLSIDAILPIFDFGTEPFFRLVEMIRVETVAEAARENVDLVYPLLLRKGSGRIARRKDRKSGPRKITPRCPLYCSPAPKMSLDDA